MSWFSFSQTCVRETDAKKKKFSGFQSTGLFGKARSGHTNWTDISKIALEKNVYGLLNNKWVITLMN